MNYKIINEGKSLIKAWVNGVSLEKEAEDQLIKCASMPFIHKHIAVMPDVHGGMGSTIGSVIPTKKAIIPAAVGVDIGCGMMASKLNLKASDLPDNLVDIRVGIEAAVPHGRSDHGGVNDIGSWKGQPKLNIVENWKALSLDKRYIKLRENHTRFFDQKINTGRHLGTLGTGNHFIELCIDESQDVWVMLHSGSRGVGNAIGRHFISLAKEDMKKWFINIPDTDLSYFPEGTEHFDDYVLAVSWAQDYAKINRNIMMDNVIASLKDTISRDLTVTEKAINCHHNYVTMENHFGENVWVTRKGAVRARLGDLGIIPGSMGAKSYIVRGKGNPDSFCSCSHGAGRVMSRTKARNTYSVEDHIRATEGVECRKDKEVIDETPMAYKDIDAVMNAQSDLVEVVHTLKQVVCVKG